ncbi:MAG: hypothetical protein C4538_00635 [Nitrospiraceae bacterium]|nr:MAG: hypothetical protein C4538_00635 [Nitrospiraceae bacterium]
MRRRPLQCPFCDNYLAPPVDIHSKTIDVTGGICTCSAVYALDRAGHNLGEIFLEALGLACKGDLDKALALSPDRYETETFDYDIHTNTAARRENRRGKSGKIIFVRLKS